VCSSIRRNLIIGDALELRRYTKEIDYFFVNGEVIASKGKPTGSMPGMIPPKN